MAKIKFEWLSPEQKREKSLGIVKKFQKEINSLQNKIMKVDRTEETIKIYFSDTESITISGWIAGQIVVKDTTIESWF
ncbi:MAG TPA: hypothetical protein PLU55_03945 [Candidatus Pacearchaeota archaeon]|nr:hypothetical protein [Candidatus Pacearchaeota archaeon]